MKKNKFTLGWFFISLLMAFAVTACDDEDDNVATVTFPEKQTIGGAASETKSLTFDAVADWTLTSSSTWCYFITEGTPAAKATEGVKEYSISGKAGKQTVTIGISDEGQDYDNTTVMQPDLRSNSIKKVQAMNGWKYRQKKVSKPDTTTTSNIKQKQTSALPLPTVRNG